MGVLKVTPHDWAILADILIIPLCVLFAAVRWFLIPSERRTSELMLLASVFLIPVGFAGEIIVYSLTVKLSPLRPVKYDLYVYQFDRLFGEPSFRLGQLVFAHGWAVNLLALAYNLLGVAVLSTFAVYIFAAREEAFHVLRGLAINFFAILFFYFAFPVSGPKFAFPDWPHLPGPFIPHGILLDAAPNAIPSGHTSSAILILYFLFRWPVGRWVASFFLVLTLLSTLGLGEHYIFDLFCGALYAFGVVKVNNRITLWLSSGPSLGRRPSLLSDARAGSDGP